MKKFALVSLSVFLILASGCSGGRSNDGRAAIIVGGWPSADVGFEAALPGFYRQFPNISVEIEMSETASYHQALSTSLAAGMGAPDVAMIEGAYIGIYRDSPAFVNLLDAPYNAGQLRPDFGAFKWNQAYSADKNRLIALSWDLGPATYFYRADVFAESGLPTEPSEVAQYMSTWQGVLDAARKVHIPGRRWLLPDAVVGLYQQILFPLVDYFNEDLSLRLDRPGDIEWLNAAIEMRRNGLDMNVSIWSPEGVAGFDTGAIVSHMEGSWFGGFLKVDFNPGGAGNWRATTLLGNAPSSNIGGSFAGIPAQSRHYDEAWSFISYMFATVQGQNDIFLGVDYFPSFMPAWDDPIYDEPDPWFGGQKTRSLWKNIAMDLNQAYHTTIMDATVQGVIAGSVSTSIELGLDPYGIKEQLRRDIDTATAELRRQQIQIYRDAGVWHD